MASGFSDLKILGFRTPLHMLNSAKTYSRLSKRWNSALPFPRIGQHIKIFFFQKSKYDDDESEEDFEGKAEEEEEDDDDDDSEVSDDDKSENDEDDWTKEQHCYIELI